MANKTIKGLTVEIGGDTTKLGKALESVEKQSRSLSSELGDINKLLKMDPGNTELLAQKQKVLAEAVETTRSKLDTLKEAEAQVQKQFEKGEASEEQVRALQREIIATTKKLDGYEKAAKETKEALEGVADNSDKAADKTDDFGKSADKAEKSSGKLSDTLSKGVTVGLAALAAGVGAAAAALYNSVEATQEYRREMGKLETAFTDTGHSSEAATRTYKELQSILGETDQAVEAANHLAELTDNEEDLATWTNIATGIYAKFGASLPIEGLTEAANETAKVGQVTGSLADALNWAEITSDDWTKALGSNKKALAAFKKATKEGEKAEDAFTAALEACANEQERQELIMNTLNGVYADAADAYRETNAEVIRSNKATERLNAVWAQVGSKMSPIVNTLREGVAELGESLVDMVSEADIEKVQKQIKRGFSELSTNVLPKLIKALEWCIEHFNEIKSVAMGFIAALAVGKITSFASTVRTTLVSAFSTLTTSLGAATTAQKGMNAAASANIYVLLAQAVIAVGVALGSYYKGEAEKAEQKTRDLVREMHGLSEAEQKAADNANAAADAFKNSRKAMDESVSSITSQYSYIKSLKDELLGLVDAEGKVDELNHTRAEFILGELNKALGTEYSMTGNQINQYKTLASEIEKVISNKKAELLLAASEDVYIEAIKGRAQAEEDYFTNFKKHQELIVAKQTAFSNYVDFKSGLNAFEELFYADELERLYTTYEETSRLLDESETAYNDSKTVLAGYYEDIGQYETAQMLALEGNTEEASRILSDRTYYVQKYADSVGFASDEVRNTWEQEAIDAGVKAALIRQNWENGVDGYTEEMVDEAEQAYDDIMAEMGTAYDDAAAVGGDLTNGLGKGMESGKSNLLTKAKNIVAGIIDAFRKEADSHSPSRKMIAFGEDLGEGTEIGLEHTTKPLLQTAKSQMNQLLDTYQSEQNVLQDLDASRLSGSATVAARSAEANNKLDAILKAIEAGKVLLLDGELLVGGTINKINSKLGQLQVLSTRGAI